MSSFAQISPDLNVMGSAGSSRANSSSGNYIQFTLGETFITTESSSDHIITQGYHQPEYGPIAIPLYVKFEIIDASCNNIDDGIISIDSISGWEGEFIISFNETETDSLNFDSLSAAAYSIRIEDFRGRSFDTTITIGTQGLDCGPEFYNAFSPNGDGVNDTWTISLIEASPENSVQIFNRWGSLVWKADGYDNLEVVWDGTSNQMSSSKNLPDGTYYYIVSAKNVDSGKTTGYKGFVEITR